MVRTSNSRDKHIFVTVLSRHLKFPPIYIFVTVLGRHLTVSFAISHKTSFGNFTVR